MEGSVVLFTGWVEVSSASPKTHPMMIPEGARLIGVAWQADWGVSMKDFEFIVQHGMLKIRHERGVFLRTTMKHVPTVQPMHTNYLAISPASKGWIIPPKAWAEIDFLYHEAKQIPGKTKVRLALIGVPIGTDWKEKGK
jgi:hypothetical protein